ncbi:MAG: Hsp20/alpha crystallin family protein [Hyphomicrobiaceae bacterium]
MNIGSLIPWRDAKPSTPEMRGDALDPFVAFRREVDRMFDDFFAGFGRSLAARPNVWQGVTPTIDISEDDKEIVVTAELPGLDQKDFEVTVSGDLLTLKGEKKSEHTQQNGNATYTERRFGSFSRSVRLPFEVRDENVEATYDKGVLSIRVTKPADMQRPARRIEVKRA